MWCSGYSSEHAQNWSYDVLEREVRANLVYRDFTRSQDYHCPGDGISSFGTMFTALMPHGLLNCDVYAIREAKRASNMSKRHNGYIIREPLTSEGMNPVKDLTQHHIDVVAF